MFPSFHAFFRGVNPAGYYPSHPCPATTKRNKSFPGGHTKLVGEPVVSRVAKIQGIFSQSTPGFAKGKIGANAGAPGYTDSKVAQAFLPVMERLATQTRMSVPPCMDALKSPTHFQTEFITAHRPPTHIAFTKQAIPSLFSELPVP